MGQRLLLVNPVRNRAKSRGRQPARVRPRKSAPHDKRGVTAKRRKPIMAKRRTAAQKAATRKMIAANRKRRAPSRRTAPKKRKVRRNPATKASQRSTYSRTAQMNPKRRRTRKVRRNPITMRSITNDLVMPAAVGAVGAIANDALFTYLPLPAQFKAPGLARYTSKGVSAIALTWLASMVVKRQTAVQLGVGALTCLTAEIARGLMQKIPVLAPVSMEGMGLYTMGYYNPAVPAGGGDGMGVYVPGVQTEKLPSLASRDTAGVAPGGSGLGVYDESSYHYG